MTEGINPSQALADALRHYRGRRGWSQEQLSDRLAAVGVKLHQSAIGKIEQGQRQVNIDELMALSFTLEVSIADLLVSATAVVDLKVVPTMAVDPVLARQWLAGQWSDAPGHIPRTLPILSNDLLTAIEEARASADLVLMKRDAARYPRLTGDRHEAPHDREALLLEADRWLRHHVRLLEALQSSGIDPAKATNEELWPEVRPLLGRSTAELHEELRRMSEGES